MEEMITKAYCSEIDAIDSHIDSVAESAFKTLLAECDDLLELESRVFHFDTYRGVPVETATLNSLVASRVRQKARLYIDNIKSQYKIVSG